MSLSRDISIGSKQWQPSLGHSIVYTFLLSEGTSFLLFSTLFALADCFHFQFPSFNISRLSPMKPPCETFAVLPFTLHTFSPLKDLSCEHSEWFPYGFHYFSFFRSQTIFFACDHNWFSSHWLLHKSNEKAAKRRKHNGLAHENLPFLVWSNFNNLLILSLELIFVFSDSLLRNLRYFARPSILILNLICPLNQPSDKFTNTRVLFLVEYLQ